VNNKDDCLKLNHVGYLINNAILTFVACSNATGNHKLKLSLHGKDRKPHASKILLAPTALAVLYKAQKNAWIHSEVFQGWFFNKCSHYPTYSVMWAFIGHI
jgi:hypothetical protein